MSHTYAQNVIHVVFSTKDRRKLMLVEFRATYTGIRVGNQARGKMRGEIRRDPVKRIFARAGARSCGDECRNCNLREKNLSITTT